MDRGCEIAEKIQLIIEGGDMNARLLCLLLCCFSPLVSAEKVLRIYHDADWANHIESAESIWQGMHIALSEVDYQLQDYRIEIVKKNHSGNVIRSKKNLQDFMADPQALLVFSGIHSPPLIKNRQFINKNKILTLVPWAAGAPITRSSSSENWIFRLSVDDSQAGEFLVDYALANKQCKTPHLLLENTPWGDSNLVNMKSALLAQHAKSVGVTRFEWGLKTHTATSLLLDIENTGADCILLVANALEGAVIAQSMAGLNDQQRLPIVSHWGISGGNFPQVVPVSIRENVDLAFLQTCFSFMSPPLSTKGNEVLQRAKQLFSDAIKDVDDIRAPVGLIHAYDLTQLLIKAVNQIDLGDNIQTNRLAIQQSLENLQGPMEGLVKTYRQPFSRYSIEHGEAHEALSHEDYCMARYDDNNNIRLL